MRLIGTLENETQAKLFSANLARQGIENKVEGASVWAHNEDQLFAAKALFERFTQNPTAPEFEIPIFDQTLHEVEVDATDSPEVEELLTPRRTGHLTAFLISICAMVYFLCAMQEAPLAEKGIPATAFVPTPIQVAMLYDVPPAVETLAHMAAAYTPAAEEKKPTLPPTIRAQLLVVNKTPFWRGLSDQVLLKMKGEDPTLATGPLFAKIRQGDFWRLLSPIFLHGSILHILFNMLWLWVLGKQIEQRVGISRYLLLTLLIGVFSNTIQYLMSGPFFLGYSGVIMGLAGFIWSREKVAPWEGYPLQKSMVLFLVLFIFAMLALQLGTFALFAFSVTSININIANSAHIAGGLAGLLLGRLPFFAVRPLP